MISFMVATNGERPTLRHTLASVELYDGDELIVVGDNLTIDDPRARVIQCPAGNDWGHSERNFATPLCKGRYVAHIDDDDEYVPGYRAAMQDAITTMPDRPVIFRMQYKNGGVLWQVEQVMCGNVGTPMILIPNVAEKMGTWGSFYGGDSYFMETMKWAPEEIVWRREVTTLIRPRL